VPGSLPVPPEVWRAMLAPRRSVCLPRDHDSVSENCAWRLCTFDSRDWPMVNGTEPARVYAVESVCASQSVTGSPLRYRRALR
jgi:hypothetical protein